MKIKLTYLLRDMHVSCATDLPAHFDGVDGAEFILWMREVEHQGQPVRGLCCDIVRNVKPPQRAKDTLLALRENQLLLDDPIQEGLPYMRGPEETIVDLQGNIKPGQGLEFYLYPKGAKPWFREIYDEISGQLSDFVKQLRWVQNTAGGHRPFSFVGAFWSMDGEEWSPFPFEIQMKIRQPRPIEASVAARVKMAVIVNDRAHEPISHDLMREAAELVGRTPRSALLVAFAALETGIKEQLKRMIPDASGLIDEMPSPPLLKIIQEILPSTIKAKGLSSGHFPLKKHAKNFLQKWVTQRNQVTHGTKNSVDADKVEEFIQFAKDILYLLDHVEGHDWALDHLGSEVWANEESH
ncbi:hypothetical protein [Roseovarius sp.]|uniref:hypothetical protein n=1 Tax=Roseovarius sp. TaxID=1486281 RepID=UPI003A974D51